MSKLRKDIEALSLAKKKARDYDPEDIAQDDSDDASDSGSDHKVPSAAGREHYEQVGKSRLRKVEGTPLGSKYGGVAVSRDALANNDSDSDALAMQSEEDDEDVFANPRINGTDDSEEEELETENEGSIVSQDDSGLDEVDMTSDDQADDSQTSQSEDEDDVEEPESTLRQQAAEFAAISSSSIAADLSQAAAKEVNKGKAIRKQNQALDRVLDARMKLQKAVVASDELLVSQQSSDSDAEAAILNAKTAAMQLFNTMTSFREQLSRTNEEVTRKRKRELDASSTVQTQWNTLQELESNTLPTRRQVIDKWSSRTKQGETAAASSSSRSKLLDSSAQSRQLTAVLDVYIANEGEKQLGQSTPGEFPIYDDNTFYQSLLRDLITSRSASSTTASNISASVLPPKLHPSGNRQNKKNVDTKASKGRKIRYTVHEKLQNFMAAEGDTGRDTAMWTERSKRDFFGSLFGQDRALNEDSDAEVEDDAVVDHEQAALRLFKT